MKFISKVFITFHLATLFMKLISLIDTSWLMLLIPEMVVLGLISIGILGMAFILFLGMVLAVIEDINNKG